MKIGMVSDIHCNIEGLKTALELLGDIDELLCAGDSVFQFRWSNDVVGLLKDLGAHVILGNHDEIILGKDGVRALSNPKVDQSLVAWLREQPYRRDLVFDGKRVILTHGAPWEPYHEYVYPHERAWAKAASLDCDAVVTGHTHFQMAQRHGGVLVINPGSAGDPRDSRNNFSLSCAMWDTATDMVVFHDYPDPTRAFLPHSGAV